MLDLVTASLYRIGMGLLWAVVIGVPVGVLIGLNAGAREVSHVPFQFLRMISPLAWMPIAVLAFDNMSGDPDQEFFSDGLSEEILNLLVKLPKLRVASRTSRTPVTTTKAPPRKDNPSVKAGSSALSDWAANPNTHTTEPPRSSSETRCRARCRV